MNHHEVSQHLVGRRCLTKFFFSFIEEAKQWSRWGVVGSLEKTWDISLLRAWFSLQTNGASWCSQEISKRKQYFASRVWTGCGNLGELGMEIIFFENRGHCTIIGISWVKPRPTNSQLSLFPLNRAWFGGPQNLGHHVIPKVITPFINVSWVRSTTNRLRIKTKPQEILRWLGSDPSECSQQEIDRVHQRPVDFSSLVYGSKLR